MKIASSLPDEINNFYARFEAHSQHRPHRECSRGCCRRGQSTLHFCHGCNPILQTGEYPQSCGSGWNTRPCAQTMHDTPLTPILSKCFEKLIRDYICSVLPDSLEIATICISQQPFQRRCYCLQPAHCSLPPGK